MSLFSRTSDLPGLVAPTRDCSEKGKGFSKLSAGDIAIIDVADINRALAQELIDARVSAVINTEKFSTGGIPNFGPQLLLDAGIRLVESVDAGVWKNLKNGKKGRLTDDGGLYYGETLAASGTVLNAAMAEENFAEAQQSLVDHMEAFFGNTIQFIHSEAPLLIDGLGVPDVGTDLRDRKVLVVSPGADHRNQIKQLRNFMREYEPAIIAVDAAADTLVELGYTPEFIVGNPAGIGSNALRSGAKVVLPADPDGHVAGLERIQDLGIGAMTFPAAVDSATDLALLLAEYHGAEMVVNCGAPLDLDSIFADAESSSPASLLARMKVGPKLVDARSIINLYTVRTSGSLGWLWAVLGLLVFVGVVIAIAGSSGDGSFAENLIDTWNNIALSVQGWFK